MVLPNWPSCSSRSNPCSLLRPTPLSTTGPLNSHMCGASLWMIFVGPDFPHKAITIPNAWIPELLLATSMYSNSVASSSHCGLRFAISTNCTSLIQCWSLLAGVASSRWPTTLWHSPGCSTPLAQNTCQSAILHASSSGPSHLLSLPLMFAFSQSTFHGLKTTKPTCSPALDAPHRGSPLSVILSSLHPCQCASSCATSCAVLLISSPTSRPRHGLTTQ